MIRAQMTGDFGDQSANDAVFSYMRAVAEARLKHGLHTVIDATNIKRKDRIIWPQMAAKIAPNTKVKYVVVNRPMEDKYSTAGWRKELPFDLISKHEQTFQSNLKDILAGDYFRNVEVIDTRRGQNIEV
jgi:predicted kinase